MCNTSVYPMHVLFHVLLGLHTISKVSDHIGIINLILVPVSKFQINNTFKNTFYDDINKHKFSSYFDPSVNYILN